jgi:hypothetical protein
MAAPVLAHMLPVGGTRVNESFLRIVPRLRLLCLLHAVAPALPSVCVGLIAHGEGR